MIHLRTTAFATFMALGAAPAWAGCGIDSGRINILVNDFPALRVVTQGASECASETVTFGRNHTAQHRDIQVAALSTDPAEYTSAIVANSSIVPLLNNDLIRPLDDLVEEYGQDLQQNQLITIDGNIMAIAFMANAQHLFVRQDILDEIGMEVPETYEEVLEVAEAIRAAGIMQYPFAMLTRSDWNLGAEFANLYIGYGGEFFEPGTAQPAINNEAGVATLEMLRDLMEYSNPDYLTYDLSVVVRNWESGRLAIGQFWGSAAGQLLDEEGSTSEIAENTVLTRAPSVGGNDRPAATLWWDGFTIAANISDEDAQATFRALIHGLSDENIRQNNDAAVWLSDVYEPGKAATGVAATAQAGARPYPMLPYMNLLHSAFYAELPAYLQGNKSAEQTLSDIESSYISSAREQGFID